MIFQSDEVAAARQTVYSVMPPTPQYAWPLLRQRLGMKVWVKHENHTPAGAFKVRGGLTYFAALARAAGSAARRHHAPPAATTASRSASARATHGMDATHRGAARQLAWRRTPRCARWAPR